ncbi:PepSY-associated TM region [Pseudidiomarina maritima]|uniref:PepSY-associated TM region n=1 Tax=Pseudidiomarina maritima TaxID=519453 RepID=A0A1I6H4N9_9GAMM|nr:PepSY domain-containing protein [Pseudidiomarina maritima]SFR49399.1 PepSY-associated TM region [Pseudidiomarina maritima]
MSTSSKPVQQSLSRWRTWHRWLSLVFGVQLVIWSISGAYMVFFELSFIHGDHLVKTNHPSLPNSAQIRPVEHVIRAFPRAREVTLQPTLVGGKWIATYEVFAHRDTFLVDAQSLQPVVFTEADIVAIAKRLYAPSDSAPITRATLLEHRAPAEISPSLLPIWQVNFDDFGNSSFYISPTTGELVTKRHSFWRGFDFLWMLHIMDYETREDITNWLLRSFILGTGLLSITGIMLLIFTIGRSRGQGAHS